jgi:hypothetical protein
MFAAPPPPADDPAEQRPSPSVAREIAGEIGQNLQLAAQPVVDDVVSTLAMLVLFVLMVPVGLVVLVLSFLTMGFIVSAVGAPSGALGSALGIGWLVGTLILLVLVFRKLYRKLPRRLRGAYAAPMEISASIPAHVALQEATPFLPAPTLAELDARHAPEPPANPS